MESITSIVFYSSIVIGITALIAWTILQTSRPTLLNGLNPSYGSLQTTTKVGDVDAARSGFLTSPSGTLSTYIFLAGYSKTSSKGSSTSAIPLLKIGSTFQFQILPGGASMEPTTQIAVQTQGPNGIQTETLSVAPFPQQKWVHLAIIREGRRYTVYYNGTIVSSQRTTYFPVVNSNAIQIGDAQLIGQFVYPKIAPIAMTQIEIKNDIQSSSDTRYEPYMPMGTFSNLFSIQLGCPNGLFCFSTNTPPTSPLKVWSTQFA
jgi:hypothetical protein